MAQKTPIALLGSTGSIGVNTLEVVRQHRENFHVAALSVHSNIDALEAQISEWKPDVVAVLDKEKAHELRKRTSVKIFEGEDGLCELVKESDAKVVVGALVGFAGLRPTLAAIDSGKDVALANKETLVVAGELIMERARVRGVRVVPIDSEHSAIWQCLAGEDPASVAKIILTASGGPFLGVPREEFSSITIEAALNHPNWKMGRKITIDSATLMNKGFEVIEARWLFNLQPEQIDVVIHPQSIIHSMVEFVDGSVKAQLGLPDMKMPIAYALGMGTRMELRGERLDLCKQPPMTFFAPDKKKFICLQLAYEALERGGTAPAALNAANEIAVENFLTGKISFDHIMEIIRTVLSEHDSHNGEVTLENIIQTDGWARRRAEELTATISALA